MDLTTPLVQCLWKLCERPRRIAELENGSPGGRPANSRSSTKVMIDRSAELRRADFEIANIRGVPVRVQQHFVYQTDTRIHRPLLPTLPSGLPMLPLATESSWRTLPKCRRHVGVGDDPPFCHHRGSPYGYGRSSGRHPQRVFRKAKDARSGRVGPDTHRQRCPHQDGREAMKDTERSQVHGGFSTRII